MSGVNSKRLLVLIALTLLTATSAAEAATAGGLHGTVRRGPTAPVCRPGVPCDAPAPNMTLTFARAGLVRSTRTDAHGSYRITLPAGTYLLGTDARRFGRIPRPARVEVRAGHSDKIDFTIDTGIR
jgi:hypothetical protein